MDELKYNAYLEYKKNNFFSSIHSAKSISSGVNFFKILDLYKDLMQVEIENEYSVSLYAEPRGHKMLIEVISYWENYFFGRNICSTAWDICVVNGATAGLNLVFDFFSMRELKRGIIIGYSYTLFAMLGHRFGIELEVIVAQDRNKVIPDVGKIIEYVKKNAPDFICLTEPLNPSGEMYDEKSMRRLLRLCKEKHCFLLIDKCQREELQLMYRPDYYSLNKLILEEKALNNVIIVNSLSKTRSLPGIRFGYVMAEPSIIDYLVYLNTITYWHCSATCSFAVAIDILYQLIYMDNENKYNHINTISELIKKYILNMNIAKQIFYYINPKEIEERSRKHCQTIIDRYSIIDMNYKFAFEHLKNNKYEITKLDGGYNFCIKFRKKISEFQLKQRALHEKKLEIFTQEDFCCTKTNQDNNYWIRISCAEEKESFKQNFLLFCSLFEED